MSPSDHESIKSFLRLSRIGKRGEAAAMLREGVCAGTIFERLKGDEIIERNERLKGFDPQNEMESCFEKGIRLVVYADDEYPSLLREIYDPPLVLYVAGNFIPEDQYAVAIVGSRHPSFYGLNQTRRFARGLSEKGLTVVSGFAKGIDSVAHEMALEIPHGRTIAVLGCGIDVEYPRNSRKLFEKIRERGAVISEYPLGTPPLAENFPRRNRIISGVSLGTLVVEAHERSGSLITAHEAAEQGREVFALPGPVDQLTSRGTNQLLKEGAALADSPEDIFDALEVPLLTHSRDIRASRSSDLDGKGESSLLEMDADSDRVKNLNSSEEEKLLTLLSTGPLGIDEVLSRCGLDAGLVVSLLIRLELQCKIRKEATGRYALRG